MMRFCIEKNFFTISLLGRVHFCIIWAEPTGDASAGDPVIAHE